MQDMQNTQNVQGTQDAQDTEDQNTQTGVVKWFNPTKRFDFIAPDGEEEGNALFVHLNELAEGTRSMEEGDRVEFVVAQGEKGPMATQVRVIRDTEDME
jgi:CspA family cold shock protein